jgi:hypothetical protein
MLKSFGRKLTTFKRQSAFVKLWILPTWLLLCLSRLLVLTISFRKIAPMLGQSTGVQPAVLIATNAEQRTGRRIKTLIAMASKYTLWNSNCFAQAITARLLLGLFRVPSVVFFGLKGNAGSAGLQAHAWVVSGPVNISGGNGFADFTVVGVFTSQPFIDESCAGPNC